MIMASQKLTATDPHALLPDFFSFWLFSLPRPVPGTTLPLSLQISDLESLAPSPGCLIWLMAGYGNLPHAWVSAFLQPQLLLTPIPNPS